MKEVEFGPVEATEVRVKPNLPVLGPKLGKELGRRARRARGGRVRAGRATRFRVLGQRARRGRGARRAARRARAGRWPRTTRSRSRSTRRSIPSSSSRAASYDLIHKLNTMRKEAGPRADRSHHRHPARPRRRPARARRLDQGRGARAGDRDRRRHRAADREGLTAAGSRRREPARAGRCIYGRMGTRRSAVACFGVAVVALAAALPAVGKEGVKATLTTRVPLTAPAGTTVRVAWTLAYRDERGRRHPFDGDGIFLRLLSAIGCRGEDRARARDGGPLRGVGAGAGGRYPRDPDRDRRLVDRAERHSTRRRAVPDHERPHPTVERPPAVRPLVSSAPGAARAGSLNTTSSTSAANGADVGDAVRAEPVADARDERFRSGGAGGDPDRLAPVEPVRVDPGLVVDQVRLDAAPRGRPRRAGSSSSCCASRSRAADRPAAASRAPRAGGSSSRSRCRSSPARAAAGSGGAGSRRCRPSRRPRASSASSRRSGRCSAARAARRPRPSRRARRASGASPIVPTTSSCPAWPTRITVNPSAA